MIAKGMGMYKDLLVHPSHKCISLSLSSTPILSKSEMNGATKV